MAEWFRNMYAHIKQVNKLIENNKSIIVFDTETTGLEEDANIIQFSGVLYDIVGQKLIEKDFLNLYINPGKPITQEIENLTGITNDLLKDAITEDIAVCQIKNFMEKADIWAAYNANFDLLKLKYMHQRTNQIYKEKDCIDVLVMARNMIHKADIKNHKLGTITAYLCPNYEAVFHNSLEDTRATGKCLEVLLDEYKNTYIPIDFGEKINIDYAKYWVNPNNGGQMRIKIYANKKDLEIFWDCSKICWSCKSTLSAKQNFRKYDIGNIEEQIIKKYGHKYNNATTMEDLAREWGRDYRNKQKNKEVSVSQTFTFTEEPAKDNNEIELI